MELFEWYLCTLTAMNYCTLEEFINIILVYWNDRICQITMVFCSYYK